MPNRLVYFHAINNEDKVHGTIKEYHYALGDEAVVLVVVPVVVS